MGNSCKGRGTELPAQAMFPPLPTNNLYYKANTLSLRMGIVQKLRPTNLYQPNRYLFILPIKQSEQLCKIQCPIITSYSDNLSLNLPILNSINTVRLNQREAPIIDLHDVDSDRQILHKFVIKDNKVNENQQYTVKVYPFTNYHDDVFKNGLYQTYLYRSLQNYNRSTILRDFFIIEKGNPCAMVFVYGPLLYSLEDILIYRKQNNLVYTLDEQLYIADQILSKYKLLFENNITHRDIRPSKIYLANSTATVRTAYTTTLGYQLINLETARKLTDLQMNTYGSQKDSSMYMSVRGVPLYCEANVTDLHLRKQHVGVYDPWSNDRVQLAKTLAMIVTLDTQSQQINYHEVKSKNKHIFQLIKNLQNIPLGLKNIIRDFHDNFGSKLRYSVGILQSDYKICQSNLPQTIHFKNSQRIDQATTQMLFALHQRELLTTRMDKMIGANLKDNQTYNNVAILDRMGRHYQGMGLPQNDYYKQQMKLLLQLSQQARGRKVPNDQFIEQAMQLNNNKFNGHISDPNVSIDYKLQNAYYWLDKNDLQSASKFINDGFVEGGSSNIPIDTQIKLIEAKGIIQTNVSGPNVGNFYFEKGLDLSNNRTNFLTQVQMLESLSNFQYLLGKNSVLKLNFMRGTMSQQQQIQQFTKSQSLLNNAKQIKTNLPMKNPLPLANTYQSLGDLCQLRQDYKGASSYYERVNNLYASSEVPIANRQRIRMLQKLYKYYQQHSDNYAEQQRVRVMIENMKKNNEMNKSSDRTDRKHFKRIRSLKQQYNNKMFGKSKSHNSINEAEQHEEQDASKYVPKQLPYNQPMNGQFVNYNNEAVLSSSIKI